MISLMFHHAAISVPDLEGAIRWYGDVLGFVPEQRFPIPAIGAEVAMLRRDDLRVEVFEVAGATRLPDGRREPHADLHTHGNKHVAFRVPDLDDLLTELEEKRVDVAMVVRESFGSACFIRDCAGNLIEFVEQRAPGRAGIAAA